MTIHNFTPTRYFNTIGSHDPVLKIGNGDTVVTETLDAHGFDSHGEKRADGPNPMTGPFYVSGAGPGDALLIRLDRIAMIRPRLDLPGSGSKRSEPWRRCALSPACGDGFDNSTWPPSERASRNPPTALRDWSVAVKPMIGCFGRGPGDGSSNLDGDKRPLRRQHGLSRLRGWRQLSCSRCRLLADCFFSAMFTRPKAMVKSSAQALRPQPRSNSRCRL